MSSKRHLRRRSCRSKVRYTDVRAAREVCGRMYAQGTAAVRSLTVYACRYCSGYHVAHRLNRRAA